MASQPLLIVENTKIWRYLHHAQFPGNRNARREPRPRCSPRRSRLSTPDKLRVPLLKTVGAPANPARKETQKTVKYTILTE